MFIVSLFRRTAAPALLVAAGFASACSSNTVSPEAGTDARLDAQMAANLAAMQSAKSHSVAVYDSLVRVWATRGGNGREMMNTTSSPFVACAPMPYDGEAKIVTSSGGTFTFGPHKLVVPAGALSWPTAIAVIVETDLKAKVTLLPHGTQFASPVKLTLAYQHCEESATHRVAYINTLNQIIEYPTSVDRPSEQMVDTWLNHFSTYAIAY